MYKITKADRSGLLSILEEMASELKVIAHTRKLTKSEHSKLEKIIHLHHRLTIKKYETNKQKASKKEPGTL